MLENVVGYRVTHTISTTKKVRIHEVTVQIRTFGSGVCIRTW